MVNMECKSYARFLAGLLDVPLLPFAEPVGLLLLLLFLLAGLFDDERFFSSCFDGATV